ncbi:hypothetical protein QCA50_018027 [Cerrena zonata]|uniref:Uncharacterized protein n=1 Tax=Cerrena zonata TaxID=2478898 RepID=A0AAW0FHT1_9APHY
MNPELFTSLIDMLEDIMPASVPSFIHSVRIADLGLGKTAARITSILSLPGAKTRERLKATRGQEANAFNERSEDTSGPNKDQEEELSGDHQGDECSIICLSTFSWVYEECGVSKFRYGSKSPVQLAQLEPVSSLSLTHLLSRRLWSVRWTYPVSPFRSYLSTKSFLASWTSLSFLVSSQVRLIPPWRRFKKKAKSYYISPAFAFVTYTGRSSVPFGEFYNIPMAQAVVRGTRDSLRSSRHWWRLGS